MHNRNVLLAAFFISLQACTATTRPQIADVMDLRQQVIDTERAFAKSMADRDIDAFSQFVSTEAIFFGGRRPLHGHDAVVAAWKRFFEGREAPFSWTPEEVEVLDSGTLALSSGPVYSPDGRQIGRFSSIWRREAPGVWRIVFDKGSEVCN